MKQFLSALKYTLMWLYKVTFYKKERKREMDEAKRDAGKPLVVFYYCLIVEGWLLILFMLPLIISLISGRYMKVLDLFPWTAGVLVILLLVSLLILTIARGIKEKNSIHLYDIKVYSESTANEDGISIEEYRKLQFGYELWKNPELREDKKYRDWVNELPDFNLPFRYWYSGARRHWSFREAENASRREYDIRRANYPQLLNSMKLQKEILEMKREERKEKELKRVKQNTRKWLEKQ